MSSTITPNLDSISLYYKEGTSDKEYHLAILGNEENGFQVQYRFGKRGAKLQVRFKNSVPTDYATARTLFESMRDAQFKDGYTTGKTGTPYQNTESAGKVSGLHPQLLNFIKEEEVEKYLNDDAWVMQEKKDGVRCIIRKVKKSVEGVNKKGLIVSLPTTTEEGIRAVCGTIDATLDGELIGEHYWMFDILVASVHSYSDKSCSQRLEAIQEWFDGEHHEFFHIVKTAVGTTAKKAMFNRLKKEKAEGVVFKRLDSLYKAGRPASGGNQVKFKFTEEATVRVRSLNTTKASFQMELLKDGAWTYVGDCTYYPTIYTPKAGDIVEIRYLYAYPGGALFQPFLKEKRTDADDSDCIITQLKYKQGTEEDDDN